MRFSFVILSGAFFVVLSCPKDIHTNGLDNQPTIKEITTHNNIKTYQRFKETLSRLESSHRYDAVSRSGTYWGKYQFGPLALEDIGFDVEKSEFLQNRLVQEQALFYFLQRNKELLGDYFWNHLGEVIDGIEVTKGGLLAASHLVGAGPVKTYLDSEGRVVAQDGNGTPLTKYLRVFSEYSFDITPEVKEFISIKYGEPPTYIPSPEIGWSNKEDYNLFSLTNFNP